MVKKTKKSAGSSRKATSEESDQETSGAKVPKLKCRKCGNKFMTRSGFLIHLVTHFYLELKVPESGPYFCSEGKCDKSKEYTKKNYIKHIATIHKQLDNLLSSKGETVSD